MIKSIFDEYKYHEDGSLFRDAVIATAREYGFRTSLVEKDYYCSLLLAHLGRDVGTSLVFKGGTALSKVYADFYRLSEDLDFVIPIKTDRARSVRSKAAKPLKPIVDMIPRVFPKIRVKESLKAQMGVELRDVLRQRDYDAFSLDEAFAIVVAVAERLEKA